MVLSWPRDSQTIWWMVVVMGLVLEVTALSGPNVCMVQQKYNITKRVKYRAPMSVRTYEWCFAMPPRCSKWSTEMRELTRLETGERIAEVAVCCPGYKMRDVTCVPICPSGKTGNSCSEDCPADKWGPNCANDCGDCNNGYCDAITGECECDDGWQGESCQARMPTTSPPALMEKLLTTTKSTVQTLATTVPITLTTISTTIMQIFTTPKPTTSTTSTEKTENTPTTSTPQTTTTPVVSQYISYENVTVTPSTTLWVDVKEKLSKTTVINFIYNRTETPEAGTSSSYLPEHVTTTTESRMTKNTPVSMQTLSSTYTPTTITTLLTVPVTTTSSPTISLTTYSTTLDITTPSTTVPSTITPVTTSSTTPIVTSTATQNSTTIVPKISTILAIEKEVRSESTAKSEAILKNLSVSNKIKPKEIWIKPSQKGEPIFIDSKFKINNELKHKATPNKTEVLTENTTPKTIIVSIIPTSISHATFKKLALTTATYLSQKTNITSKPLNKAEQGYTKSMDPKLSTAIPFTIKILSPVIEKNATTIKTTSHQPRNNTEQITLTSISKKMFFNTTLPETSTSSNKAKLNASLAASRKTNSMIFVESKNLDSSTISANKSLTNKNTLHRNSSYVITTPPLVFKKFKAASVNIEGMSKTTKANPYPNISDKGIPKVKTTTTTEKSTKLPAVTERTNSTKRNASKILHFNRITTQETTEDETFHILTEPEHITAVMSDKERDHTSVDLISVISIAGGVMMAVITVAVIIVMVERCKRHRYDDVRKINDIRMQVMIDNNDVPPPYVRSIFHTPLPDPPADRNHYQPISTLDRNLKQFMRPVVVQAISPIMLENFRGILECHYDHLPHANQDFGTMPVRCSVASSIKYDEKLLSQRPLSVADYTIEALKCEAKLDVIDCTTSEPLYAEIPCWRPPSEHAIEVLNFNGEAVTEL